MSGTERPRLVSVVIPCFNYASYLSEAIESVLRQSWPTVELIVVDDGSTDDTADVTRRHAGVKLIRTENRGLSAARNRGLAEASGEFIVFLDADDRLLPDAIDAGARQLRERPDAAFAAGRLELIDVSGKPITTPFEPAVESDFYQALLARNYVWTLAAVLYRRRAVVEAGGFEVRLSPAADYDLNLRLTRMHPIAVHDTLVAQYRQHGANMSERPDQMLAATCAALRAQRPYLGTDGLQRAYRAGLARWTMLYGRPLMHRAVRELRGGRWREAGTDVLVLLRNVRLGEIPALMSEPD